MINRDELHLKKCLVVGAGGIGCELIKTLVMEGLDTLTIVDLDTIDVSNLNRQFLFRREHVGKSKAEVAKQSALHMRPSAKLNHYHESIFSGQFDVNFFKSFDLVMNALDNKAARSHVNRMCLGAAVPLIESGSAGYLGQVSVIQKGLAECYDCRPKPAQRTFPGCTIRNTPSEPQHCVVWAKHLFNQLFGEPDPDEDVSPDMTDPELQGNGDESVTTNGHSAADPVQRESAAAAAGKRTSTRKYVEDCNYQTEKVFDKLFNIDVQYLLTMGNLWKDNRRRKPVPLSYNQLPNMPNTSGSSSGATISDQLVWSIEECRDVFCDCVTGLRAQMERTVEPLVWDKDDTLAMDFVAACANLRSHIFGLERLSRFQLKSIAGNIVPAIASTNAIVAGLIVAEAMRILSGRINECQATFIARKANPRGQVIVSASLEPPNPHCYVCAPKPEVRIGIDLNNFTVAQLETLVLKGHLNMVAPDVEIPGTGVILISSEEGETEELAEKPLSMFKLRDGDSLVCDDFLQQYNVRVVLSQLSDMEREEHFKVLSQDANVAPQEEKPKAAEVAADGGDDDIEMVVEEQNGIKRSGETERVAVKRKRVD